jgi:hypothetical protein
MSIANKSPLNVDHGLYTKAASGPQLKLVDASASAADVRRMVKVQSEDPALYIKIRSAGSPSEKHAILREAGLTPVTDQEIQSELAKCLRPGAGAGAFPDDSEFIGQVLHLVAADSTANVSS